MRQISPYFKSLLNVLPWRAEEGCFTRTSVDGDGDGEALAAAGPSDKPEIAELGNLVDSAKLQELVKTKQINYFFL